MRNLPNPLRHIVNARPELKCLYEGLESTYYFFFIFLHSDSMFPCDDEGYYCFDQESHYVETWKEMEKLVDSGKTKTIGLSNFNKAQIVEILSIPGIKHRPAVLQNESHPYLQEKDLRDFCRVSGIVFQVRCFKIHLLSLVG